MSYTQKYCERGFTLLSMMMVLAIIGLLTGAVVVGKDLIRSSELLSVTADVKKFSVGVNSFRDKYAAIPGDFSRATDIWGTSPDGCAGQTLQTTTCDGDGDGRLFYCFGFCMESGNATELFTFWQHLSNAGFISGLYTGGAEYIAPPPCGFCPPDTSGTLKHVPGKNIPRAKLAGGGYSLEFSSADSMRVRLSAVASDDTMVSPILTPEEAQHIDTKMDDGLPDTGSVTASGTSCTVLQGSRNVYNSSNSTKQCYMTFSLSGS